MKPLAAKREVTEFLAAYNKVFGTHPEVLVECGARDSMETTLFSELNPQGRIFSFECNPRTLPKCRERVAKLPNVELVEKAVTDQDGTITFYPTDPARTETTVEDGNPGASSLFKANPDFKAEKYVQNEITVPATRLDTFMNSRGIAAIDAMWMDIQGAEMMALRGLGENLRHVRLIHLEVEFFEIYLGQPLFPAMKQFLNQQGFRLYRFTRFHAYDADAIFVNLSKVDGRMKAHLAVSDALGYLYRKSRLKWLKR